MQGQRDTRASDRKKIEAGEKRTDLIRPSRDEPQAAHAGCNVENAAYPAAICAERTAFVKAVSEGCRRFTAIAVTGGIGPEPEDYSWPCGECRQFMREFCEPDRFVVITAKSETDYRCYTLEELLPESFGPGNLVGGERYGL